MRHRAGDAHACLLQSIHSRGGVTPPPLTDCFLLSLLLNYFSSDSHMWVFSSLAGNFTLWRREAEAQLTGAAGRKCVWLKKAKQCVCQGMKKDRSLQWVEWKRDFAPAVVFRLNSLSCSAPPPPPCWEGAHWKKVATAGRVQNATSIHHSAILLSLPSITQIHYSCNCSNSAKINTSSYK